MAQKEIMRENLLEEINAYISYLVYLQDIDNVYKHISALKSQLEKAPNFTLITEAAFIDSLMMTLAKLYDKSKKAKTIPALIKKCKKNINLFPNEGDTTNRLDEFETTLDQDKEITSAIDILLMRRDNIFAHNDPKYFGLKKIEKDKTYLPMYKIWKLINLTEEVLDYLFSQLSSEQRMQPKYNRDLEQLFN